MHGRVAVLGLFLLITKAAEARGPGATVMGRALAPGGAPIVNARVELYPVLSHYEAGRREAEGQDPALPAASAATAADGRFALRAPEKGMWRVLVLADGFVPQQHQLVPLLDDIHLAPVELAVDSGIRVRVLSPQGSPIAGAQVVGEVRRRLPVTAPGGWEAMERRRSAGADGVVRLPKAANETLRLWVAALGYPIQEVPETRARAAVLRLAPGVAATVELEERSPKRSPDAVVRDLAGRFVLGRPSRDGRLTVTHPSSELAMIVETADGRRVPFRSKPAAGSGLQQPSSLSLPLPSTLTGRIIDRETRRPIPGALVWPESDPGRWVATDAEGAFRLAGVTVPSETGLKAAALGHAPGFVSLQSGLPGSPQVLALAPTAALHGTVSDARGRPLAHAEVSLALLGATGETEARSALTSALGAFRVPALRAGASYLATVALAGFAPVSTAVAIPKPEAPPAVLHVVLRRGRTAAGQVVDGSGRPVAGARVELVPGDSGRVVSSDLAGRAKVAHQTRTGAEGRFELVHLPAGWFRMRIEAAGFRLLEQEGLQIPTGSARTNLGRFLLQRGATFEGWVGDADGMPLGGAEVWIIPKAVRDWTSLYAKGPAAVTNADGSFILRDLSRDGSFGLDVCRAGYLPLSAIVREIPQEPYRAVLQRAARISGKIIAMDGAPLPAARIESWPAGEKPAHAESLRPCRRGAGLAVADAEGRFLLDGLPPGWWNLRASADGLLPTTRTRLHVQPGESLADVEIALGPGAVLFGRVFSAGGEAAPGARVSAFITEGAVEALAGGDGTYRLAGVEPGERTVEATLGNGPWASRTLSVLPGDNRLDLTMDQGAPHQEIRGRVVDPDGLAIAGAIVMAGASARTFSGADGSFILAVEDGQEYHVMAAKEGFATARAGVAVRVAGAPVEGVEIQLGHGGVLSGRLLGLDREELVQASVEVELNPPFQARAVVDSQGTYRIEDVPPGEWSLTARVGDRVVRERVSLPPGAAEASIDLAFAPSYEVSGWVSGPGGETIPEAYVRFFAPGGGSSTFSRADGSFRLRLEDGTYRAVARREGYLWTLQPEAVAVEGAPVAGLELHLEEAAVIRGRILGLDPGDRANAVWASDAAGGGRRDGQLDPEGGFVIPNLTPGDWTVTVSHDGREVSVSLHVEAGQREERVEVEMNGS